MLFSYFRILGGGGGGGVSTWCTCYLVPEDERSVLVAVRVGGVLKPGKHVGLGADGDVTPLLLPRHVVPLVSDTHTRLELRGNCAQQQGRNIIP